MIGSKKAARLEQERIDAENAQRDKALEEQRLVRSTTKRFEKEIANYGSELKEFIVQAAEAKKLGLTKEYKSACTGIAMSYNYQKRMKQMLLNMRITDKIKNMTKNTNDFVKSLAIVSQQLSDLNSEVNYMDVEKTFDAAMANIGEKAEMLEELLQTCDTSIDLNVDIESDAGLNEFVAKLVDDQMTVGEGEVSDDMADRKKVLEGLL